MAYQGNRIKNFEKIGKKMSVQGYILTAAPPLTRCGRRRKAAAVDGSDGGDAKLVPNLKLKAIRNVKSQAMNSQTSLSEWTTSAQSIPLAAGTSGSSVTIAGGKSIESLKTALSNNGIWDSPAAEDYSSRITFAIDSIGTIFDTIVTNLTQ